ncbi:unnamed protein product [Brassica oleracea]
MKGSTSVDLNVPCFVSTILISKTRSVEILERTGADKRLESNADTNPGAAPFSRVFAKIYWECVITYAPLGGNSESGDDMPGVASVTSKPRVGY